MKPVVVAIAALMLAPGAASADRVTVPLEIRNGFPIVVAKIDGKPLPLMVDIGGDFYLTLSESALQGLKTTRLAEMYEFSDAKGNVLRTPMFAVARMEIGAAVFADVKGHLDTSHPTYQAQTEGRAGMIGVPLLQAYTVVFDYAGREMILLSGEGAEWSGCTGAEVPFMPQWEGSPVTRITTDAGELAMVWDTGAPLSMIRKGFVVQRGLEAGNATWTSARFGLGGTNFGPHSFHVLDYVEPAGTDGFIGYPFFEKNVVCLDFPRKRLFVAKSGITPASR